MNGTQVTKEHLKPTGLTATVEFGPGGARVHRAEFPKHKPAIEKMIADLFWTSYQQPDDLCPFGRPIPGEEESDLDFTIRTVCGDRKLELAEFAPLNSLRGKYENAPTKVGAGDVADEMLRLIAKKTKRYGGSGHFLLIYVTEGLFTLSPPVRELLWRHFDLRPPARFERVFFMSPSSGSEGHVYRLHPGTPFLVGDSATKGRRQLRQFLIRMPDLRKFQEALTHAAPGSINNLSVNFD